MFTAKVLSPFLTIKQTLNKYFLMLLVNIFYLKINFELSRFTEIYKLVISKNGYWFLNLSIEKNGYRDSNDIMYIIAQELDHQTRGISVPRPGQRKEDTILGCLAI